MDIKELQKKTAKVMADNAERDNIDVTNDYLVLKLSEELGEFVQSYIVHNKRCRPEKYLPVDVSKKELSKELGDILGVVLSIADALEVDVEEALVKKWITREWIKS